jgi:hypothetical protein
VPTILDSTGRTWPRVTVVTSTFDRAMRMMRKHDPQTREDGFWMLKPVAAHFLIELIEAFEAETDLGLKCWLLELIGSAHCDDAAPLLARELTSGDESLRSWAAWGLGELNSKPARTMLREHGHSS